MQPEAYRLRTSGIACLAVACGRPLLVPEGTWAARRFCAGGSAICYRPGGVAEALAAIEAAAADYPRHADAARHAAARWAARHGVERFLDAVLADLGA